MTYYEELGLTVSASSDDIRKAHRTVSRLLHPDQQRDDALRRAAELQMRRVNAIVDILLDAQQRQKYDDSLRAAAHFAFRASIAAPRQGVRSPFFVLDIIGIIVTATIITLLALWLLVGDFIHRGGQTSERGCFSCLVECGTRRWWRPGAVHSGPSLLAEPRNEGMDCLWLPAERAAALTRPAHRPGSPRPHS